MKKSLLLTIFFSFLATSPSLAQKLSIVDSSSQLFPASCDSGSIQSLKFKVVYTGSSESGIGDTIRINYSVNNSSTFKIPYYSTKDTIHDGDTLTIEDASFTMGIINGFQTGVNDIVVIWPTGSGGFPIKGDSTLDSVHVVLTGIAPIFKGLLEIVLYPVPAENQLYLNYDQGKTDLEQVRIYDLLGRAILTKTSLFNSIAINALPEGLYFLEAIDRDENRYTTQFVKTR